jgi:peptidoglycan/xylan/chitin deacetylase (PgdA/CDA1 family)
MYHSITGDKENDKKLQYPPAMFRQDLQWMYDHNYRPVSLTQFAEGKIDCPAGMSPVILTFDDGLKTQYNMTSDGKIDPNCALGILEDFHAQHPDWQLRGTFFVLTDEDPKMPPPFYQREYAQGKMEHLVSDGFDIGNHTVHHRVGMKRMPDSEVLSEFAGGVAGIHKYLPDYDVVTLALPYGVFPKNEKLLNSGSSGGTSYKNICALDAAWQPEVSPMSAAYKPMHLERVMAGAGFHQSRWWFNYLEQNKGEKFVSDGDPNTYTISQMMSGDIDKAKVEKMHFHFRTYNGTQMVASK